MLIIACKKQIWKRPSALFTVEKVNGKCWPLPIATTSLSICGKLPSSSADTASKSLILYKKKDHTGSKFHVKITKTINLKNGDVAYIPPRILHTHGAVKNEKVFSHIAINFYLAKNNAVKTVWFESDLKSNLFHKIP